MPADSRVHHPDQLAFEKSRLKTIKVQISLLYCYRLGIRNSAIGHSYYGRETSSAE
jgi:hypothetical protein